VAPYSLCWLCNRREEKYSFCRLCDKKLHLNSSHFYKTLQVVETGITIRVHTLCWTQTPYRSRAPYIEVA